MKRDQKRLFEEWGASVVLSVGVITSSMYFQWAALSLLLTACFIVLYRVFFAMEFVALSHESPQFRTDIREPVFFLACLKGIYFSSALCSSFLKDISLVEVNEPSFWEFTNAEQKVDICLSKPTQYTFLYRKIFRCFWV